MNFWDGFSLGWISAGILCCALFWLMTRNKFVKKEIKSGEVNK